MTTRLESEVWALDNCSGCGLCVAACSKQVLKWNGSDHPILEQRTKTVGYTKETLDSCSFCQKFCEEACPRLQHWAPLEAQSVLAASARGPMRSGAPNDVIRAILAAGRSAGLLDGILMLDLDPWDLKPVARIASTVLEVVSAVGPQYLWAPVYDALNEAVFEQGMKNIAVVSTPCAAQAMRKLKASTNTRLQPYQEAVRLTMAVFCTGIYRPEMIKRDPDQAHGRVAGAGQASAVLSGSRGDAGCPVGWQRSAPFRASRPKATPAAAAAPAMTTWASRRISR